MRRVYKWPLEVGGDNKIPWSDGDRVLLVAEQPSHPGHPTLWAEQEEYSQPASYREFFFVGTGMTAPPSSYEHVGSAVCAGGQLVWHVYAEALA